MNDLKYLYFKPFIEWTRRTQFQCFRIIHILQRPVCKFFSGPKFQCVAKPWRPTNRKQSIFIY